MSSVHNRVTVIIPIAPEETAHQRLLDDLQHWPNEIIVSADGSRAKSLNTGATKSQQQFLWFLHADSHVSSENLSELAQALAAQPHALHYFDLAFDGGGLVAINGIGANIRSRLFGLPYGDQGFCMSKTLFDEIGTYPEDVPYGEDLIFIRRAKQQGIQLNRIPSKLVTSSRKYRQQGWLKLTLIRWWHMFKLLRYKL